MKKRLEFTELLYKTITNIDVWQDVLEYLCKATGAPKGIITLRDWEKSEMLIPNNIHIELQSPMLYGFSEVEIGAYITEYYQLDPWTKIENEHHPISPYAMSTHFSTQELQKTPFWQWLKPQNISDSVVVDIHSSDTHWVSVNLFFDANNEKIREASIATIEKYQSMMDDIWGLGLQHRASKSSPENLIYFLEQQAAPSILIDANLKIIHKNKAAEKMLANAKSPIKTSPDYVFTRNKNQLKDLKKMVSDLALEPFDFASPPRKEIPLDEWTCSATLINEAQNIIGEDTALRLISIASNELTLQSSLSPTWENFDLTNREKELVEVLASGGRVIDFQKKYGLAKSTAHNNWSSVKQKLKVTDRAEIIVKHQLLSQEQ